ncbi:MAG: nucleotidyltransferase family protein [Candidatus Thermoplasmatota archaeon]|nr:nucleotidyltransferase family protein [Candidatus Thermoplasmatota archaeon]
MIGAILAGGYGKRLKPLTDEIPKSLIQINENYTIMDRQLFDFRNLGVKDIYFLTGHLGNRIEEKYGSGKDGMNFFYLREEKPLGTLYSMRNLIEERSDQDVLLRNGDTVTDLNFRKFVDFSMNSNFLITMFIVRMRSPYGIVDLSGDTVMSFREKPLLDSYINAGIYLIKKEALDRFFDKYHYRDLERTVFPKLSSMKLMGGFREDCFWMGIDSEKDLEGIRTMYSGREDYPWGYRKVRYTDGRISLHTYYIKEGEGVVLDSDAIVKVVRGSIHAEIKGRDTFEESDIVRIEKNTRINALENSTLDVTVAM